MNCRKSVADLSGTEVKAFVTAVLDLKNPTKSPSRIPAAAAAVVAAGGQANRYDDYVWLHNKVGLGAHRGSAFGPWHREFLRQFEFDLQQVSQNPELTIPYWDWTAVKTPAHAGWPFTPEFLGGLGNAATGVISTGPFADPAVWRVNIRRPGDNVTTLKRSPGVPDPALLPTRATVLRGLGVGLPAGTAWPKVWDAVPFNGAPPNTTTARTAQAMAAFRKYLEWLLHDSIHTWIGGLWNPDAQGNPRDGGHMSFPAVSVNDPVFWLHHGNVDRIWSIWQRKSPAPQYVPAGQAGAVGSASRGHNGSDTMVSFGDPSFFATAVLRHPVDLQDHKAIGAWYHTDDPDITLATTSINFGLVPTITTAPRAVQLTVRTCQPVTFTVTGIMGPNFASPAGQGSLTVDDDHGNNHSHNHTTDSQTVSLPVTFRATGPLGTPQAGSATVTATIIDRDGYDTAAPGSTRVLGTWTVPLTATPTTPAVHSPGPVPATAHVEAHASDAPGGPTPGGHDDAAHHQAAPHHASHHPAGEDPTAHGGADAQHPGHGPDHDADHGDTPDHELDHDHDHATMHFDLFQLDDRGQVIIVAPEDIGRDVSGYDDEGNDAPAC